MLTDRQMQDESWIIIHAHYEKRLADLRRQNDRPELTDLETATLRGRIAEVKKLLSIADPKPAIED